MRKLSSLEKAAIASATRDAERRSHGEIVTVIAPRSDAYHAVMLLWSALISLLVPGLFILLNKFQVIEYADLRIVYVTQLFVFLLLLALLRIPLILRWAIPSKLRRLCVQRAAQMQFYTHQLQHTQFRCGILVYVSLLERRVELLADKGINDRVAPTTWQLITDNFITRVHRGEIKEGFVNAIEACGAILALHFPADVVTANELADELVEVK